MIQQKKGVVLISLSYVMGGGGQYYICQTYLIIDFMRTKTKNKNVVLTIPIPPWKEGICWGVLITPELPLCWNCQRKVQTWAKLHMRRERPWSIDIAFERLFESNEGQSHTEEQPHVFYMLWFDTFISKIMIRQRAIPTNVRLTKPTLPVGRLLLKKSRDLKGKERKR